MAEKDLEKFFGYTETELNEMACPFEEGEWPEGVTKLLGRPRLANEEIKVVSTKIPASELELIDRRAKAAGITRSQFIRDACRSAVARAL